MPLLYNYTIISMKNPSVWIALPIISVVLTCKLVEVWVVRSIVMKPTVVPAVDVNAVYWLPLRWLGKVKLYCPMLEPSLHY